MNLFELDVSFLKRLEKLKSEGKENIVQKTLDDIASKSRFLSMEDKMSMKQNFMKYFDETY
jgi:RNA-dependent RNA polymerase